MSPQTTSGPAEDAGVAATVAWSATAAAVEAGLFEVVGAWALEASDPEVAVTLAAEARHAAWRAEQLAGLLAPLGGLDLTDQLALGRSRIEAELGRLATVAGDATRVATLVSGVLVPLTDRYRARAATGSRVAQAPMLVVADRIAHDAARARGALAALDPGSTQRSSESGIALVSTLDAAEAFELGEQAFELGEQAFELGEQAFELGEQAFELGEQAFDPGESGDDPG